ncbi:H+/Cl-antiporter ClcA [Propionispira arboris]|uniref:H+/Cl-antiporter ClcA n=1 Tax=Propionispira arboris TaxID=84035 RepID=A0A1H6Z197_9FIRM|nr:H(+)/Cl(-) exchange transporter ClcA [Propionispira arboris]SEJ43310.1 H+/Cl-antiporter ClcA [Propionispira arboris]
MKKTKLVQAMEAFVMGRYFRMRLFIEGILVGVITGLIIALFRFLIEKAENLRPVLYEYFTVGNWPLVVLYFSTSLPIAYFLYKIVQIEPQASGSGIPQIKGILLGKMHMNWLRVLFYKFMGGVIAIGSGMSLGREGPSVQLGASIGQGVSRSFSRSRFEERFLLTSGAGAGLAAAFNAPLAGVIFCLEELQKNFSPLVLMATIAATVTSTAVVQQFFGYGPIFHITGLPMMPIRYYGLLFVLGIFMGVLGRSFNKVLLKSLDLYDGQSWLHGAGKPALPLLVAGLLGFVLPQVLGGGNQLVDLLVTQQFSLALLVTLFVAKFFFTMLCFGSGSPGGIFLPMLVLGALGGSIFSGAAIALGFLDPAYAANIIIFAMAGYFSAVVKAPVTGSVLIMEMTGSFEHMLALIFVSMLAYVVMDMLNGKPVYDELLERSLAKKKKLPAVIKYRRTILELVIESGSRMDGKCVKNVQWPAYSLVVNLKRGESEIIPTGDTRLQSGDYLYILVNDQEINELTRLANK